MQCLCGSKLNVSECCEKYMSMQVYPDSAEKLMRSRYYAYATHNIAYITKTMNGAALVDYDEKSALEWSILVKWVRLEVLGSRLIDENTATVEFKAFFKDNGRMNILHENSLFNKIQNKWLYVGMNN